VLLSSAAGGAAGGPDEPSGLGGAVIKGTVPPSSTSPVGAGVTSSDGLPLPATPLLDDFNRSDGPLGSNWAQVSTAGTLGIQSGIVKVTSGGHGEYYWTPASFGPDVEAYVDSGGLSCCQTQDTVRLLLRVQQVAPAAFSGYELISYFGIGGNGWWLRKYANGSYTDLASRGTDVWEHMLFRAVGDTLQGWASHDGVNWTLLLQATDSTYQSAGFIGFEVENTLPNADNFGGGTLGAAPGGGSSAAQSIGTCSGSGAHAVSGTACAAEPVNTLTGAYTTHVADLQLPGIGVPFDWSRSYTSADTTVGPLGPGWTDSYAASLAVQPNGDVLLHGDEGQQVYYTKQPDGSFVGAAGARSALSSVSGGGYKLVRHDQVVYLFDQNGLLTSERDRNGQGLTFAYDGQGQLQTIIDSVGRHIAVTYASGLVSQVTLPDGRFVGYGYTSGRLTSVTDARGGTTQYSYDAGGRLATIVDQNGHQVVRNVYDPTSGRVSDQYDPLDRHSTFAWDAGTQTSTLTDARSNQWKDVYAGNLLVKRIDPLGNTTRYDYEADLNVKTVTDARGNATSMTYDDSGNLLTRTVPAPLSYGETWTYNARNDPLTYTDGRGNQTAFGYDPAGNLTSVTGPDADGPGPLGRPTTSYGRDPAGTGLLASITDPRGKQTSLSYTNGDLTQIVSQLGNKTTVGYDGSGRMTSLVDPRGNAADNNPADYTWSYAYNEANQLRTQTDPLGHATTLAYDPAGNLSSRHDANSHVTGYGYDDANRLTSVTAPDPDGGGPLPAPVTGYAYDAVGNLASRTDANSHVTTYGYDAANRPTQVTAPGNRNWTYAYDPDGNVQQVVDANGNATPSSGDGQTTYGYDALDRLSSIDYSDTTPDVSFGYDANGNRIQMTDGAGTESYVYDALDRLTSVTRGSDVFSYGYDLVNPIQATYPGQPVVSYAYDDDERLQSAARSGLVTGYGYDAAGNLTQTTLPSGTGVTEARDYDRAGRLTDVTSAKSGSTLSGFAVSLDPVGNPLSVVRTGSLPQTQTYSYDAMDRLTGVCFQSGACPGGSDAFIRWSYDGVGNRLSEERPTGTTSYTYDVADELTRAGSTVYTYDQDGNELSAGSRTFAYDLANRPKATTLGNTTTTYVYDGDGKRLQASTGQQANRTTNFLWDMNQALPQLALERDGNNSGLRAYLYGLSRISQTAGSASSYFLYDGLGSVANLVSSTGTTQWTWSYEPFGATRTEQKANGKQPDSAMRFTGEYLDPTGLYHLRARQYDPATGRFLTVDPLSGGGSVSRYVYAQNRPTVLIDPTGLLSWKDLKDASIGVAKTIPDALHSIEDAAEIAEERAGIPEHIKQIPRVGATALRLLPVTVAVITVGDVYVNVRSGDSIPTAIGRSVFRTGGAILGAGRAASGCAVFVESGPGLVACAGVAGVAGAFGGERAGDALANRILGRSGK
jgi:RHS repeat-associated protein